MEVLILIAIAMVLVRVIGWKAYNSVRSKSTAPDSADAPSGDGPSSVAPATVGEALAANPTPMARCTLGDAAPTRSHTRR